MTTYYCYEETPIGDLLLAGNGDQLELLGFPGGKMGRRHDAFFNGVGAGIDLFKTLQNQYLRYCAGWSIL